MHQQVYGKGYGSDAAQNYQRFFVPAIGRPVADDLIAVANLKPGDHVLDVACGTGVVTRLAADGVGDGGSVTGLDVNPGMLSVARAETPSEMSIDWREASADSMPFEDETFDVVLCQMGLQFFPSKLPALREMRRVLKNAGFAHVTVPGPKPALFEVMIEALARHVGRKAAMFGETVFSMHDADALTELMRGAGFRDVNIQAAPKTLHVPAAADFLWQYLYSTPLIEPLAKVGDEARSRLQSDVTAGWRAFAANGGMTLEVGMTTASGRR